MGMSSFKDKLKDGIKPRQREALVGDSTGVITVTGRAGFVYVRTGNGYNELLKVFGGDVIANKSWVAGQSVIIQEDPTQADMWRVVDFVRDDIGATTGVRGVTVPTISGGTTTIAANTMQGSSSVTGDPGAVAFYENGSGLGSDTHFVYDKDNDALYLGSGYDGTVADLINLVYDSANPPASDHRNINSTIYDAAYFPFFQAWRARGSKATPTAIQSGDTIMRITGGGHDGVEFASQVRIKMEAAEIWAAGSHGTKIILQTTPNGSVTAADGLIIHDSGTIELKKGIKNLVTIKSADYTLLDTDNVVVFTATATATLPAATGSGQTYRIICRAGLLTIDGAGSETIKGELSVVLEADENIIITDTASGIWE